MGVSVGVGGGEGTRIVSSFTGSPNRTNQFATFLRNTGGGERWAANGQGKTEKGGGP